MRNAPFLVTGSTGNVGALVVEALLAAGKPVRAAGRTIESVHLRFGDRVEAVALDFTVPSTWAAAFDGIEAMFLMRPPQLGKPKTQMLPALDYALTAGITRVVFLSLQGAEDNKVVPHAAIEQWLAGQARVNHAFVRASFFMQNLSTTHATDIRDRDEIVIPAGRGATAFVDVTDVAAVAVAALLRPDVHRNVAFTPTGPAALTYQQVADVLTRVLGRDIRYANPSLPRYAAHARRALGMPWGMVAVTCAIYTIARMGRAAGLTDDVKRVCGREPIPFEEFAMRERAAWSTAPGPAAR